MAGRAIGGGAEEAVVWLGAGPGGGGLVAALARGLAVVDRSGGASRQAKGRVQVAGGALIGDRDTRMKSGRPPVFRRMASNAVSGGRNVFRRLASCGAAVVTGSAVGRGGECTVVHSSCGEPG